jgi:hypothetical protein
MSKYIFLILFLIGCESSSVKKISSKDIPVKDIEKYEKKQENNDTNITKNNDIEYLFDNPRYKYRLDGKGNVLDEYGNIIAIGATLDPYHNIIGTYVPTLVEKIRRNQKYSIENIDRKIKIDDISYQIESTLDIENGLRVGFSHKILYNFLGYKESKGYVFSPLKYVAVFKYYEKLENFFSNYENMKKITVITHITPRQFRFINYQIEYESTQDGVECYASVDKDLIIYMQRGYQQIGKVILKCDLNTGRLYSKKNSTTFNQNVLNSFEIVIPGFDKKIIISTLTTCSDDVSTTDTIAPPEPPACVIRRLSNY